MKRRDMLLTSGAAALGLAGFPMLTSRAADAPRRRVLMFTRSAGFQHPSIKREGDQLSHAERVLSEVGKRHGFDVTATKDGGVFDSDLGEYDTFFFYTTGDLTGERSADGAPPMSAAGKKRLLEAVADGKGFMGSHCASDTFHSPGQALERQNPPDDYIAMLGGEFITHGRQQKSKQRLVSPKFPGAESLGEGFEMHEEWYSLKNFADNLHVILVQDTQGMEGVGAYNRPPFPATWARMHGKGRVFYTSMGHREDVWSGDTFQSIVLGGLAWTTGNVDADVTPNIAKVTPGAHVMPVRSG